MLCSWMQDIEDFVRFAVDDWRARGGSGVDDLLRDARASGLCAGSDLSMEILTAELACRMDTLKLQQLDPALAVPKARTVRWYQQNADEPVAAGSTVTVRQACFCLAALKLRGGMTGTCLDTICRMLSLGGFCVDENNMIPRWRPSVVTIWVQLSLYMITRLDDLPQLASPFTRHGSMYVQVRAHHQWCTVLAKARRVLVGYV